MAPLLRMMIPLTVSIVWRHTNQLHFVSSLESMYISDGFTNWKEASVRFPKHEESNCHREAMFKMVRLPATTHDISESLSSQFAAERLHRRQCFLKVLFSRSWRCFKSSLSTIFISRLQIWLPNCISQRFDQPGYQNYKFLQELLVKTVKGEEYVSELHFLCDFYGEDICESCLGVQLETLASTFKDQEGTCLADIIAFSKNYFSAQTAFLSEVGNI